MASLMPIMQTAKARNRSVDISPQRSYRFLGFERQTLATLSTEGAEYTAFTERCRDLLCIGQLLQEILGRGNHGLDSHPTLETAIVFSSNQAAINTPARKEFRQDQDTSTFSYSALVILSRKTSLISPTPDRKTTLTLRMPYQGVHMGGM